jgi:phage/plasmid-like protein (TIGR03299 family)
VSKLYGAQIPEGASAMEALTHFNMDWHTELVPTYYNFKDELHLTGKNAHIRTDTGRLFGIVTDGYKPVQNKEVAQFVDSLAGEDAASRLERMGLFNQERILFFQIKLPRSIQIRQDRIDNYVLVTNGHGGSHSFAAWYTAIRVSCENTFRRAHKTMATGIRWRHTSKVGDRVREARAVLEIANHETEMFEREIQQIAGRRLTEREMEKFLEKAYDKAFSAPATEAGKEKKQLIISDWTRRLNEPNQKLAGEYTLWAAVNAVNEYVEEGASEYDRLFGSAHKVTNVVMELALSA